MEHPVFSVYIGQTEAVIADLDFFDFEEINFANSAVKLILELAVRDASGNKLKKQYSETIGHVTVAVSVRLNGKKIHIVIVHVSTEDDWDPNGGKGLDAIAYSNIHEIAKAFATPIGRRINFRWMYTRLEQMHYSKSAEIYSEFQLIEGCEAPLCDSISIEKTPNNEPPPIILGNSDRKPTGTDLPEHLRRIDLAKSAQPRQRSVNEILACIQQASQLIVQRNPGALRVRREESPNIASANFRRDVRDATSLPLELNLLAGDQQLNAHPSAPKGGLDQHGPPAI